MQVFKRPVRTVALWLAAFGVGYGAYQYSQDAQFAHAQEQRTEVRRGLGQVEDIATAFRNVGKVVEPSVVNISVRKKVPAAARRGMDEDMLRRFFREHGGEDMPGMPDDMDEFMPEQLGTGSGVIMEVNGSRAFILTNNHVAGGAEEMVVTLSDGREVRNAKLVGADAKSDLAVVSIDADRLVAAKWGDSDQLQKGDWIMAFGSPFGYVGSMTHGIVSALKRSPGILGSGGYENFIQVDAPINPGNSGGPLVNLHGEVVGVNTAIASRTGGFQGIGFAIPSNQAKFVYTSLKEKGKVVRGWLGVGINDVAKDVPLAKSFGFDGDKGVLVDQIIPGTPAENKLQRGDIITQINGKPVQDTQALRNQVAAMPPGANVQMTIFRNGKTQNITLTLGEQPENVAAVRGGTPGKGGDANQPDSPTTAANLGLRVQTLTAEMAEQLNVDVRAGAVVTRVDPRSAAAREGIRRGDVITEVGNKAVKNAEDFTSAFRGVDLKKGVRLYVVSREGSRYVFLAAEK